MSGRSFEARAATPADFEFCFLLNERNMRALVERLRGWDEKAEREAFAAQFCAARDAIVAIMADVPPLLLPTTSPLALHYVHYNFVRIHKTLRCTPAMEAGVSDRLWTCRDIAELLEQAESDKCVAA